MGGLPGTHVRAFAKFKTDTQEFPLSSALSLKLPSGRSAIDAFVEPIKRTGALLRVVDVGARNGMMKLPQSYARHAELIGFEPNEVEHRKLVEGTTDAAKGGFVSARYAKETYLDCALWDAEEERNFYVTAGAGASTMMGATRPSVTEHLFQDFGPGDPRTGHSFYAGNGRVVRTVPVKCKRLDAVVPANETVDFLKLDVEGAELRVLRGAESMLSAGRILFVYSEFVAFPFYDEHPVLGDQHAYLRDQGYRMIALELGHQGYTRTPPTIPASNDRRLLHAGDVCFVLDPDRASLSALDRHRLGVVSLAMGFNSFGISLLRDADLCDRADIDAFERALSHIGTLRRLKEYWNAVPGLVDTVLHRVGMRDGS